MPPVTIPDAARQLGVKPHVVYWLVATNQVPSQRAGHYRLVHVADVATKLAEREKSA